MENGKATPTTYTLKIDESYPRAFCVIHVELDDAGEPCDYTYLRTNDMLTQLGALPKEQLVGRRFYDLFPGSPTDHLRDFYECAYNDKTVVFDTISEEVDRYLHVECFPLDEPGVCVCVFHSIKDEVLEDKRRAAQLERAVEELEEERRINQQVKQYAVAMGIVYPLAISLDYLNNTYHMLEYEQFHNKTAAWSGTIDELIAVGASTIPDDDAAARFSELFGREGAIRAFRAGRTELTLVHPQNGDDGLVHWMETKLICMECTDNAIQAISVAKRIDEQKAAEIAQSQLAERDMVLSALSTDYDEVYLCDIDADSLHVVKSVHGATDADGKYSQIGQLFFKNKVVAVSAPDMLEKLSRPNLKEYLQTHDELALRYQLKPDASGRQYAETRFVHVKSSEGFKVVIGTHYIDDIVEEQLQQRELLQAAMQHAEDANAAKTEFLQRMSHDVRTPLNGIRGMLDIADKFGDNLAKQADCRSKIRESSNLLLELINEVLDMSKLESGSIALEHVPFSIVDVAREVYTVTARQAEERGVQIIQENCQVDHPMLMGSPTHVKRLIMNIISNAIKYNKDGGKVYITCREVDCQGNRVTIEFKCRDTGIGMSPEFQERIFEPFAQEEISARSKYSGTGLGMPITKSIVEAMGGTITFESVQGEGTTFDVLLPFEVCEDAAADVKGDIELPENPLAGMKLLLVEDNDLNLEIARFLLEEEGATVEEAHDGSQALDAVRNAEPGTYDAVLMDVMMPVMDGYAATRAIRQLPCDYARKLPIIAMTANAFAEDKIAAREAGMDEHISKPLDAAALVSTVRKLVCPQP